MKTLLAILGLVALAAILFVGLNFERFRKVPPPPVPLASPTKVRLPPLPDKVPPVTTSAQEVPAAISGSAPESLPSAPPAITNPATSWETLLAARYAAIVQRIGKETK